MITLTENSLNRLVIYQDQSGNPIPVGENALAVSGVALGLAIGYQLPSFDFVVPLLGGPLLLFLGWRYTACSKCVFDRAEDTLTKGIAAMVLPTMRPKIYFLTDIIAVELVSRGMFRPSYFIQVKTRWNQRIRLNIIGSIRESEAREIAEAVSRFLEFTHYNEIASGKQTTHRLG